MRKGAAIGRILPAKAVEMILCTEESSLLDDRVIADGVRGGVRG